MTREPLRAAHGAAHLDGGGGGSGGGENDLLAGLWEEAPFARLPLDAPAELREYVEDVHNPKRVYAIYRASRRHNFQQLVEKYVTQLRTGCESPACSTATCFTCRKRLAGKGPIRRYNISSARTLAVYLASQDNPENDLCPYVRLPQSATATAGQLIFMPKRSSPSQETPILRRSDSQIHGRATKEQPIVDAKGVVRNGPDTKQAAKPNGHAKSPASGSARDELRPSASKGPNFTVSERPMNKDYRSFAANVFGTVAFKMLEWLTPNALDSMSQSVAELQGEDTKERSESSSPSAPKPAAAAESSSASGPSSQPTAVTDEPDKEVDKDQSLDGAREKNPENEKTAPSVKASQTRRNSNARVRTSSASKPTRKLSIEPFPPPVQSEDPIPGLVSPRLNGIPSDKALRPPKTSQTTSTRSIPEIPATPGFFDHISALPPSRIDIKAKSDRETAANDESKPVEKKELPRTESDLEKKQASRLNLDDLPKESPPVPASIHDTLLPQTLHRLTPEIVDLFCDILQDDGTLEPNGFELDKDYAMLVKSGRLGYLERKRTRYPYPQRMKQQWKLFIEQTLFRVLSDPWALVRSFTKNNQLYDSQSLWYCMLRMSRVAPSLVFDSLWIAAASLFPPPRPLQSLRSPTMKAFRKSERPLSNVDAGRLMAICLHALVAAAPLSNDATELRDVSRIRSSGRALMTAGGRQPSWVCLRYDDAFSNDLALRLARRLFTAITTRRYFTEMILHEDDLAEPPQDVDVLQPLLAQMDFLNVDKELVLEFSSTDRRMHETRVPILLLDWARTVMLEEWDGQPEFSNDGPFGGAVSLIAAMYQKRQSLFWGDISFRLDYLAERLDSIDMPVAWLSSRSTRQRSHLLDYPYLFNSDTLVSYFRSINFSRMSRTYEESSSLQTRMNAIVAPESLITNPHHKMVLQDLLKTASCRYLILDISRTNVIRDTFDQIWQREERELMRPLKVKLGEESGEEGFDSGGVQQEFFRMAIAECLNPDYGAFTVDDRTRMAWFVPGSIVDPWKFELVGLIVSLAVYNGLTLPITFPKALYRKLLGEPVEELHHIADGWPDLASGLTTLLEWDETSGLVEEVFCRTYEFSVDVFGQPISREMNAANPLWPQAAASKSDEEAPSAANPADAPLVTNANRNAYVSDYIRYLTDISVRPQFEAFERGFRTCLHPKSLTLLTPTLLQSIIEGVQEIDVTELRRYTRYVGWDASHRTVKDFWSIVKRYDDRMKRKLLEFVTASDRVPVGGMKNLQFVVQKNGEEEGEGGHLPTAYTCYGTLLLPEYRDKEVLRERLTMALENAQGFGFA